MTECVTATVIAGLEGTENSNPKLVKYFPESIHDNLDELLSVSLPFGAEPGNFYERMLGNKKIIVYIFKIDKQNTRGDVVSIGFTVDKSAMLNSLQDVILELIKRMKDEGLLTIEILQEYLPEILNGLQKESKIKIGKMVFDINTFLKTKNMTLSKESRKIKGELI